MGLGNGLTAAICRPGNQERTERPAEVNQRPWGVGFAGHHAVVHGVSSQVKQHPGGQQGNDTPLDAQRPPQRERDGGGAQQQVHHRIRQ